MNDQAKLAALRDRCYQLADLPDGIRLPPAPGHRKSTLKSIEWATLDDIADALITMQQQASALYRQMDALRAFSDRARQAGARGADIALDAIPFEEAGDADGARDVGR